MSSADNSLFECCELGDRFRARPPADSWPWPCPLRFSVAVGLCGSNELTDLLLSEEDCDFSMLLRGDLGFGAFSFGKSRSSWLGALPPLSVGWLLGGVMTSGVVVDGAMTVTESAVVDSWPSGDCCPPPPPLQMVGVRGGEADSRIAWLRVKCLPLALAVWKLERETKKGNEKGN